VGLYGLLDEGLAEYVCAQVASGSAHQPQIAVPTPLRVLARHEVFFDWLYVRDASYSSHAHYAHAHAFARYLIERYDMAKFKQLCVKAVAHGLPDAGERLAEAVRAVYDLPLPKLEQEWREAERHRGLHRGRQRAWERFTEPLRRAVYAAQGEAKRLGAADIAPEHLLLALLADENCGAARVLHRRGVSLSRLRQKVEQRITLGLYGEELGEKLSESGQHVVRLAFEEARQFDKHYIGTEHLLLGLIREGGEALGPVFAACDLTPDTVREGVCQLYNQR